MKHNSEVTPLPAKATQTHIHQPPNHLGPAIVALLSVVLAPVLLWQAGLFLLDQAGDHRPEQTLSKAIIIGLITLLVLLACAWFTRLFFADWLHHRETMAQYKLEALRQQTKLGSSISADSRVLNREQSDLIEVCIAIMWNAYDQADEKGQFTGPARPWSRRNASQITLDGQSPIGEALASKARRFLEEQRIIIDNEINQKQYPDLRAVQRKLYAPVLALPPAPGASYE